MNKGNVDPVVLESGEENNPKGHLVCLRENGVTRLSLGVQSFQTRWLKGLGTSLC